MKDLNKLQKIYVRQIIMSNTLNNPRNNQSTNLVYVNPKSDKNKYKS